MKALLFLSSFIYFVSVLAYVLVALIIVFAFFTPETYTPHGIPDEPKKAKDAIIFLSAIVGSLLCALTSYFASKQKLYAVLIANFLYVFIVYITGVSIWALAPLLITAPPIFYLLFKISKFKQM